MPLKSGKSKADIEAMHDRLLALMSQTSSSIAWQTLHTAHRAIDWVLGFDDHMASVPFEDFIKRIAEGA